MIAVDLSSQNFSVYVLAANSTNTAEIIDNTTPETLARIHFDFPVERISGAGALQLSVMGYTDGLVCCKEYTLDLATLKLAARAFRRSGQFRSADGVAGRAMGCPAEELPWPGAEDG